MEQPTNEATFLGVARILPFDCAVGTVFLACYKDREPVEISAEEAVALLERKTGRPCKKGK